MPGTGKRYQNPMPADVWSLGRRTCAWGELPGQVISVDGEQRGWGRREPGPPSLELRSQVTFWGLGGISEQNQRRGCGDGQGRWSRRPRQLRKGIWVSHKDNCGSL